MGATSKHYATGAKEINARSVTIEGLTSIGSGLGEQLRGSLPHGHYAAGNSGAAATGITGIDYDDPLDAAETDTSEASFSSGLAPAADASITTKRATTREPSPSARRRTSSIVGDRNRRYGTPDFASKTLQTLASLDSTPTGHQLIDKLQSNGHTATIRQATPAEAAANDGGVTTGV